MKTLTFVTLFPTECKHFLMKGLLKGALSRNCFLLNFINLRDFGIGRHNQIDDYPYSHQQGMLLRCDVVYNAITSIADYQNMRIIYTCPKGKPFSQATSTQLASCDKDIIFVSGYYEGIDERIFDVLPIERVSVGDFIVNSGDCAAAVMAESVLRQLDGVLGNSQCVTNDSHFNGLLEAGQYTQPTTFQDHEVPPVLKSGHHKNIEHYKQKQSLKTTLWKRPDLLGKTQVSPDQKAMITEIIKETVVKT